MINSEHIFDYKNLQQTFQNNNPFPFVIIDNFLNPWLADLILGELKRFKDYEHEGKYGVAWKDHQYKKEYMPSPLPDQLDRTIEMMKRDTPLTFHTLSYLNSPKVLNWLSLITGIDDLICDETFLGGGVHKVNSGGHLAVHTDFTIHWNNNLARQLNLLIYLNKDWEDEYNGNLELWDPDLTKCVVQVRPLFNRAILFRTTGLAYHGHPIPLNTPENVSRYSLALYYYITQNEQIQDRPVDFKVLESALIKKDAPII